MSKQLIPAGAVGLGRGSEETGVVAVQEYLQRFGYLASDRQDLTADEVFLRRNGDNDQLVHRPEARPGSFDEATEEALQRFQAFAGIAETGQLDEATRDKMNQPRCGNPDVGAAEFVTGVGSWGTTQLTYSFANYSPDVPVEATHWAIDQAFALWSAETPLRFRRVADGDGGDIVIRFVVGDHADGFPFDGPGTVLAHAFFPNQPNPIRGDTHFDDAEPWVVNVPTGAGIDLVTVAAHEFGHALGLRHSADATALMAPFYGGPRRFLSPDDILGIQSLYGGVGALENATWVHGNAAVVEHPARLESQRHFGFYHRLVGNPGTDNWFHFALPTPVIEDGDRLSLDRFMLRAVTGSSAVLRDVHIRDGERVVALHNFVNRSGNLLFERFGVASVPDVLWGLSISLGFDFGAGSAADRRVDLISAGFDYKP